MRMQDLQDNRLSEDIAQGFMTASEASVRYQVSIWTVIKAARRANIPTKYCRKRWRRVYAAGSQLEEAIERYLPSEKKQKLSPEDTMNQALDALRHAFSPKK